MEEQNKQNKQKAIEIAVNYEKKQGRNPEQVNKIKKGYDIKSNERLIDVRFVPDDKINMQTIPLTFLKKIGKDIVNFYIYIIYNLNNKPKLKILNSDFILRNFNTYTNIFFNKSLLNKQKDEGL